MWSSILVAAKRKQGNGDHLCAWVCVSHLYEKGGASHGPGGRNWRWCCMNINKNEKRKSFRAYERVYVASLPVVDPVDLSQTRIQPLDDCTWISVFTGELLHQPAEAGSLGLTGERRRWCNQATGTEARSGKTTCLHNRSCSKMNPRKKTTVTLSP